MSRQADFTAAAAGQGRVDSIPLRRIHVVNTARMTTKESIKKGARAAWDALAEMASYDATSDGDVDLADLPLSEVRKWFLPWQQFRLSEAVGR